MIHKRRHRSRDQDYHLTNQVTNRSKSLQISFSINYQKVTFVLRVQNISSECSSMGAL
jgi:hypothetical protein